MSLSLAKKIVGAFGAAFLLVLLISLVSYWSLNDSLETADRVRHTQEVLAKLEMVASRLMAADSAGRAYIITLEERYLKPCRTARPDIERACKEIHKLCEDNPEQQQRLETLKALLAGRMRVLRDTLEEAKAQSIERARPIALINQGSELTEEIRGIVATMESAEKSLLAERIAAASASGRRAIWVILVSNVVVMLLLGLAGVVISSDLTARKRAEEALRGSQERLALASRAAKIGTFEWNIQTNQATWTEEEEALYGLPPGGFGGRYENWKQAVHPEDRSQAEQEVMRAVADGTDLASQYRIVRPDGRVRWMAARARIFPDSDGRPLRMIGVNEDITERRQAELDLRQAEERLRAVVNHVAEGIITIDERGMIQSFNPAAERLFGCSATAIIGQHLRLLMPEPSRTEQNGTFPTALLPDHQRIRGSVQELSGQRQDGSTFPLELSVSQFYLGEDRFFTGIVRDITERKEAAQRLRASEEKYRLLFERNPLPLWIIDPESQEFLDVNEAAVQHYGYARAEWLALKVRDIRPAEDVPAFETSFALARQRGQTPGPHRGGIARHSKKDGTVIHVEITFDDVRLQGRTVRFCLGHDVTEQVQAAEALRQEKDFIESLIETAPAIVLVLDVQGRIVRTNSYLGELTGRRPEEVQGQDWFTIFLPEHDQARIRALHEQFIAEGREPVRGFVNRILTRDGREREVQWFSKWLRDERGVIRGVLGLGHDITELKRAEERAVQAERLAAIGEMVTGLAHESRNALQRSQACLKMLSWEVPDQPKALELVERLQQALDHLRHLYEAVRSYAAPLRIDFQRCHLGQLVQQTWEHLERMRFGRQATLTLLPTALDLHCAVDCLSVEQVLRNILENALAACPDPVAVEIQWAETLLDESSAVQLTIRDNGPGLSAEQRERIFEPFYTTKTQGTGLGMAIARRIIEAHHGRIAVGANGSPGAELVITFPRGQP